MTVLPSEPFRLADGSKLRDYQKRAAHKVFTGQDDGDGTACIIDMGLGKTVIVLTAIKDLFYWGLLTKPVLVVAPILVCETVWRQEALAWSHTRNLTFSLLRGSDNTRRFNLYREAHIYLINPESLDWLHTQLRGDWSKFDMLVIDESSMFKSHSGKRFKLLSNYGDRHTVKGPDGKSMHGPDGKPILVGPHRFKRSAIMTGTPAPTSLLNLWSPMYLMDHGKRLHSDFNDFRDRFFYKERRQTEHSFKWEVDPSELEVRPEWMPKDGAPIRIHELIADCAIELNGEDYGVLPQVIGDASKEAVPPSHLHYVELPPELRKTYDRLEKEALVELGKDFVMAANGGAKTMMCWQIAQGFLYWQDETGRKLTEVMHNLKLDKLGELIERLDVNAIIPYYFRADYERITGYFNERGISYASLGRKNSERVINDWNAGRVRNLLIHPQSAAHGINLQSGGYTFIWYSLLWSLERYMQTLARLARSGQGHIVGSHHIAAYKTVDDLMLIALGTRGDTQTRFRKALSEYQKLVGLNIFNGLGDVL